MIRRKMTPVVLSDASKQRIQEQLGTQTVDRSVPKSTDPKHFPVWGIPAGKRVLVYVPNHVVEFPDGSVQLRMDMPILHPIQDGNRFRYLRCINGIIDEEAGYDGSCPLCDGTAEPWDLARARIDQKCKAQGLDPEDKENKDVKTIRTAEFGDRCLKEGERYFTFPIAVFETDDDCKKLVKDDKGNIKYSIYWYSISEKKYNDTWGKTLQEMEDEPSSPAGYFFVLSYVVSGKQNPNVRDAARALSVHPKTQFNRVAGVAALKQHIDEETEIWTPEKARETVIANILYSREDLEGVTDDLLATTRSMLAVYEGADLNLPSSGSDAPKLELKKPVAAEDGAATPMEETDEDFDIDG